LSYLTGPLSENTTVIGAGAVQVWVRSSTPNVDLQATISEVRPDGKETFVQNGWLRANERKLDDAKSTPLEPVLSLRASDVSPLPSDRFVEATIPLYYEAHAYRAGSRIRVTITAPNGDQPIWSFSETQPTGPATVSIASSPSLPSSLLLPVVPGVSVPTGLPPCPGLRGEPCRNFQPYVNPPENPTVGCIDSRRFGFTLHHRPGQRIVKARIYVNGHLRLARRAHNLRRLTLKRLPQGVFTVRIVANESNGAVITSVRQYRGCTKTAPHTRIKRHSRH
jgi:hypothetical protein